MSGAEHQSSWGWLTAADFYFGGTGASLFLFSLILKIYGFYGNLIETGFVTGLVFVVIGLACLAIHIWARRGKFLGVLRRPNTSWISRGAIFSITFLLFGILYVTPYWFGWIPWTQNTSLGEGIGAVAGIMAFLIVLYPGMLLQSLNSIPFWNSPITPLIFISYGLTAAVGILSIALPVLTSSLKAVPKSLMSWQMTLVGLTTALLVLQLITATSSRKESKESVIELTRGRLFGVFILGVMVVGLIVPLITTAFAYATDEFVLSAISGLLILIGSLLQRYSFLSAGIYVELRPLVH